MSVIPTFRLGSDRVISLCSPSSLRIWIEQVAQLRSTGQELACHLFGANLGEFLNQHPFNPWIEYQAVSNTD